MIEFYGINYKPIFINPVYVTSVTVADRELDGIIYTLVYVQSKSEPYLIKTDIREVIKKLEGGDNIG